MENASSLHVLLVADGSGGHLIPALRVAETLAASGARVTVWYAQRRPMAPLTDALARAAQGGGVAVTPIPLTLRPHPVERLWQGGRLWRFTQRSFAACAPDVVVGFGGWVSVPVVLAARLRRIGCVLHEQNVVMGRANRWLAPWVDRVALSFEETRTAVPAARAVVTGLPIRQRIGQALRADAAQRFGFEPSAPTVLVLGGSQGARTINQWMGDVAARCTPDERRTWQVLHVAGATDAASVQARYAACGMRAWVAPYLPEMEAAYAHADVVVARAGASTIAELARCGLPAVLIPYPHAGAHQRANAQLVEAVGGAVRLEESVAAPERLLATLRLMLADRRLLLTMGLQMRTLACDDAAARLTDAILALGSCKARRDVRSSLDPSTPPAHAVSGRGSHLRPAERQVVG